MVPGRRREIQLDSSRRRPGRLLHARRLRTVEAAGGSDSECCGPVADRDDGSGPRPHRGHNSSSSRRPWALSPATARSTGSRSPAPCPTTARASQTPPTPAGGMAGTAGGWPGHGHRRRTRARLNSSARVRFRSGRSVKPAAHCNSEAPTDGTFSKIITLSARDFTSPPVPTRTFHVPDTGRKALRRRHR